MWFIADKNDIKISRLISKKLQIPLIQLVVSPEELQYSLMATLRLITFQRISRLENCIGFFHVFKLAFNHSISTVLSANGMDELFCGYDVYRRRYTPDEIKMRTIIKRLVSTALKDKEEIEVC